MDNLGGTMGLIVFLAVALERLQETVLGRFVSGKWMLLIALVLAVAASIALKLDGLG